MPGQLPLRGGGYPLKCWEGLLRKGSCTVSLGSLRLSFSNCFTADPAVQSWATPSSKLPEAQVSPLFRGKKSQEVQLTR